MARPVKNYCDYFPHDRDMRNHRKVKAIRNKFGIAGYGMWSMLVEYLTGIDGNIFEYSDTEFELMAGDFGVSVTEIRDLVDYCIKLEMLFNKDGWIHSESLDENLLPVYEKRNVAKSLSAKQLRISGKFTNNNAEPSGVSVTETPQSKVNKSRVNKIRVNNTTLFKDSEIFNKEKFNLTFIDWPEAKRNYYFEAASLWSQDHPAEKKVDWGRTIRNWDTRHPWKPNSIQSGTGPPMQDYSQLAGKTGIYKPEIKKQ